MAAHLFEGVSEQAGAARERRTDALALQRQRRWRGAMYLMGDAVECTLKARLMEIHRARTLPSLERALSKPYRKVIRLTGAEGHSIPRLVELADGLSGRIK